MKLKEMADTRADLEQQGYDDEFIRLVIAQRLAIASAKREAKLEQERAWRDINRALRAAKRQELKAQGPQARIDSQVSAPRIQRTKGHYVTARQGRPGGVQVNNANDWPHANNCACVICYSEGTGVWKEYYYSWQPTVSITLPTIGETTRSPFIPSSQCTGR